MQNQNAELREQFNEFKEYINPGMSKFFQRQIEYRTDDR